VPRIVSLLPAGTEWVAALGLLDDLVGVTFECDHPPGVRSGRAVVVTGLSCTPPGGEPPSPAEIDARVREAVAAGRPLYTLDGAAVRALSPDVVLTQDLCRVCALPADAAQQALEHTGRPARVVTLNPARLDEVLDGATAVALACGAPEAGTVLRAALQDRLDRVAAQVDARERATGGRRPRVLALEWTDPPFLPGHWVPDLLSAAGGVPVLATPGGRSAVVGWDAVASAAHPGGPGLDCVLVAPCGFGLADAVLQARQVLGRVPAGVPVWAVDAGAVVTRPGPRLVDGVEALAATWHPGAGAPRPDLVAFVAVGTGPPGSGPVGVGEHRDGAYPGST